MTDDILDQNAIDAIINAPNITEESRRKKRQNRFNFFLNLFIAIIFLCALAFIIWGFILAGEGNPVVFQGQLEAHESNIAPKITGRVEKFFVKTGDYVDVGDELYLLNVPEVDAKVEQALAMQSAAAAVAKKAKVGARSQQISMAKDQMQKAQAGLTIAQKTYDRISALAKDGLIAKQKNDEAYAQYQAALSTFKAAQAQYDMAIAGTRIEDIEAAYAQEKAAAEVVAEAMVALSESHLKSPISGNISEIILHPGELAVAGVPILTIVNLNEQKVLINVREDYIQYFELGKQFKGKIPALNNKEVIFKVYATNLLPDYATWRPTRTNEGFDMKTFRVQAQPLEKIEKMRPGMSVLINLSDLK